MTKKLKSKRGEAYLDMVISTLLIAFVLVFIVGIFNVLATKQKLDYFAREMSITATTFGRIGEETDRRYEQLAEQTGLRPQITFRAEYFSPSERTVQLGEPIMVEITHSFTIFGFGAVTFPLTVTSSHSGLSQIYWK